MRTAALVLMLVTTACNSKPKPDFSRFIIDVETIGGIEVTIAGRPVPLATDKDSLYGSNMMRGMVDFKESEVSSKTIPVVTMQTPCGPKPVPLKPDTLRPPNESNVVILKLSKYEL